MEQCERGATMNAITRPFMGLLITWGAGLASVWNVLDGILETLTLLCGALIGVLTVCRLLRELGWIPKRSREHACPGETACEGGRVKDDE